MTVSAVASCCVRFRKQWVAHEHLMYFSYDRLNVWVEIQTVCAWVLDTHVRTGFSVTSHYVDFSSLSVTVTDQHASAMKGMRLGP